MSDRLLQDKIVLIIGASRGIGAAVAKRFAREGAHILLVARTISKLEEIDDYAKKCGSKATIIPLDITDFVKIDELANIIYNKFGKIDVLIGNAAILGLLTPLQDIKPDVWEKVINTNLTANYRLIRAMHPLLRNSNNGKAIFVTSNLTNDHTAYWSAYIASKAALEAMVKTYASEALIYNIRANLIDPGLVATDLLKEAMPGKNLEIITKPDQVTDLFVKLSLDILEETGKIFKFSN